MYATDGAWLLPGHRPEPVDPGPVGIVAADLEAVAAYLDAAPVPSYVVIRGLADVPERLGGLAILSPEVLTEDLRDALTRATLGS